eukprot:TRINITY_DN48321_c0_g1_i1.p1 TRINITY_DN48321_c0_g1~~TRINITY_DN48321_c0_g1_i1.p1  ORF type:complete len:114 (-),score=23.30 TRINITY_DN48321_c0_g1_i1:85-426(-)
MMSMKDMLTAVRQSCFDGLASSGLAGGQYAFLVVPLAYNLHTVASVNSGAAGVVCHEAALARTFVHSIVAVLIVLVLAGSKNEKRQKIKLHAALLVMHVMVVAEGILEQAPTL